MLFRLDTASSTPLADQIAIQVRSSIVDGSLSAGERLPPARELSRALGINIHTVLRGYAQLRDDGLVEMGRGRGAWIRSDAGAGLVDLAHRVRELVTAAQKLGMSRQDLVRWVEQA